jgi:hypothetical protein
MEKRKRRTDFASPWLDHAKRTAVHWYGEPLGDWQDFAGHQNKEEEVMELSDAKKAIRRNPPTFGLMKISQAATLADLHLETLRRRVRRGALAAWEFPRRVALADVLEQFRLPAARSSPESQDVR